MKFFWREPHRLFVRIFLHGLLLILGVSIAVALVFALLGSTNLWHSFPSRLAAELSRDMVPGDQEQTGLSASLAKMHRILKADMAVYTYDGQTLARAGVSPPLPLDELEARKIKRHKIIRQWGLTLMFLPIPKRPHVKSCYVIIDWPFGGDPRKMAVGLLIIVLLVGFMSIPLARALTRPLEQVTGTARELASGNLEARTGVVRKDEVGVLAATIDDMASLLDRRIKAEKELLANVSHEIRTPLARIKVALGLCEDDDTKEEELRDHLHGIARDAQELEQLIEDVLIVARLDLKDSMRDSGLVTVRKTRVGPEIVVQECERRFRRVHPGRELSLHLEKIESQIFVDEKLFRRALDNLLDNAVRYSDADEMIEFRVRMAENHVVFEVMDRGIGVSEDDLPKLFEPFYRSERSRSRKAGGTGLGLTLCKRIAEAHGSTIEAVARDDGGMIFRIRVGFAGGEGRRV